MRGDSGTIAGTAQGRTDLDTRGRFALRLCHPKPQRDPKAHPRKETEAQKRLSEEGFGKKRLLIRLRYSSYRVSPDGRGAQRRSPAPPGTCGDYCGYEGTRDASLRGLCFTCTGGFRQCCACPRGSSRILRAPVAVPCPSRPPRPPGPAPASESRAREGWGPLEGSGSCSWEVLGLNVTCRGLGGS